MRFVVSAVTCSKFHMQFSLGENLCNKNVAGSNGIIHMLKYLRGNCAAELRDVAPSARSESCVIPQDLIR